MYDKINIEVRKPIWLALSELYLDTELQDFDFKHIALTIIESPFSFEEVKVINKYEVFPILQPNLLNVAGEWSGFQEDWLVKTITNSLIKRNAIKRLIIKAAWLVFKKMNKEHWEKLEKLYVKLDQNPK